MVAASDSQTMRRARRGIVGGKRRRDLRAGADNVKARARRRSRDHQQAGARRVLRGPPASIATMVVCVCKTLLWEGRTMHLPRRKFLHLAAGAAALPAVSRVARAQAYPSRPVRIIVGFPPGTP